MAQAMITLTWCDRHLSEKDEEVPAESMPAWADGWQVDLCAECAAPVLEVRSLFESYGAKGKRTPTVGAKRAPVVRPDQAASGPFPCPQPDCGAVLGNRASLGAHARQIHKMSIGQLEGKPLDHVCPECGQGFSTPQGMAVHARKHQRSA